MDDLKEKATIIDTIINLMEDTERFIDKTKTGSEKKDVVMLGLRKIIGDEMYYKYEYFIGIFIDFTVKVSKGLVTLHLNEQNCGCCVF